MSEPNFVYLHALVPDHPCLNLFDVGILLNKVNSAKNISIRFLRENEEFTIDNSLVSSFNIDQTGDRHEKKICDRCLRLLDTSFFQNNRHKKDNIITKRPSCKDCRKVKDGIGISAFDREEWNRKLPKNFSSFCCPICTKTTIVGITKVVLDHNHNTGDVRGFLCESCNTGIGRFDDDPEILFRAIEWLSKD